MSIDKQSAHRNRWWEVGEVGDGSLSAPGNISTNHTTRFSRDAPASWPSTNYQDRTGDSASYSDIKGCPLLHCTLSLPF